MGYNPKIHHRQSIRLKNYNYSAEGFYFITICTQNRECILGNIENITINMNDVCVGAHICAQIKLTKIGTIVKDCLHRLEEMYTYIKLHNFIIMPNHIHMILEIERSFRAQICAPTKTIGQIIRGLKAGISGMVGYSIWQRNYYEHIIRNENELYKTIEYIQYNPLNWEKDKYYK